MTKDLDHYARQVFNLIHGPERTADYIHEHMDLILDEAKTALGIDGPSPLMQRVVELELEAVEADRGEIRWHEDQKTSDSRLTEFEDFKRAIDQRYYDLRLMDSLATDETLQQAREAARFHTSSGAVSSGGMQVGLLNQEERATFG